MVKDFHFKDLHEVIKPFFFATKSGWLSAVSVRLSPDSRSPEAVKSLLAGVARIWPTVYPDQKYDYSFFDDDIAKLYEKDQKTSALLRLAMGIAIFISCMGLLGLATFAAQQRSKEVSIRKVLGASVTRIVSMLTLDFLWPVALAIVIATPVAWYFMHAWLQDFAYRTTVPWWVFGLCGLAAIAIALLTVGFQTLKAAITAPVKSLRAD